MARHPWRANNLGGNMLKNDFINGLSINKNILKQFVSIINENDIHERIKDFWTIYEHIDHLVVTQKMLLARIQQFIVEDKPIIKPYIPENKPIVEDTKKTAKELVDEFIKIRDMQISLIKRAKRNVWQKEGTHPEYSKYSFEILLRHILLHDSFHMWRMEELWIEKEELIQELK
jgi:uncharacterized damage-inducible protein DinB